MDKHYWMKWGITGTLALASGYAALFDTCYPCPPALLATVVGGKYNGWKAAVLCGWSLWMNRRHSLSVWAEIAAVAAVWLVMMILRKRKSAPVTKAAVSAVVWVGTKASVLYGLHLWYRYGIEIMVTEVALIVTFSYTFFKLYAFIQAGKLPLARPEGILVLVTAAAVVLKGIAVPVLSMVPGPLEQIQIIKTGVFLVVLWIGYTGGVKEGAVAGVTGGTLLAAMTTSSPSVTMVLACGGMGAGLCGNEVRVLGASVFSAVTLFFGLAKGMATLYVPIYVPLAASTLFLLLPKGMDRKLREIFAVEDLRIGYNLASKQYILQILENYQRTFQYLSRAYILQRGNEREEIHQRSGRMIMAYQFKGMADAVERLAGEVRTSTALPVKRERRYRLKVGKAGLARDGQVSGDSVCYGEVSRGQFAVALSDGMGNGRKACEESNLTVQTMYRLLGAGFQPELALRIMNSILLYRAGDEIFSTLDLALIDQYTGTLQLYKTGASLTLIKREGTVEVVKIPALPMGIVGDIPVPSLEYRLKAGDQILLLSDGVAEAGRHQGIQWLTDTILGLTSSDPQTVADLLIHKAIDRYEGEKEKDDMTAVVIVVQ